MTGKTKGAASNMTKLQELPRSIRYDHVRSVPKNLSGHGKYISSLVYFHPYLLLSSETQMGQSHPHSLEISTKTKGTAISMAMELLAHNCPVCWALTGVLRPHAPSSTHHRLYTDCKMAVSPHSWLDVKKQIRFEGKNRYCYGCHLPLGANMLSCHRGVASNRNCPFSDIAIHIAWVIRNAEEFWTEANRHFGLPHDLSVAHYSSWLALEKNQGSFQNELELCYWFVNRYRLETLT
jgi:hypothetical protein